MAVKWRLLFLIWLMMLVAYIDRVDIAVAGPSMMASLRISKAEFGFVLSAFTLGYALMQVPGGRLADRFGSKPLLVSALVVWSAFTAATGMVSTLARMLGVRALFGVGEGIENGAQFKLIADSFEPAERSQANGLFLTALALGPAFGTPLAAWILVKLGWRDLFLLFAVLGLIVAALLYEFLPRPTQESVSEGGPQTWKTIVGDDRAWLCGAVYLLFNATFWGFMSWSPTYLTEQRHISLQSLGFLGSLPYLSGFCGLILIGRLGSTLFSAKRSQLVASCYGGAGVFLALALSASTAGLCIGALCLAAFFLFGAFGPFWGMVLGFAAPTSRGVFSGFVNFLGQVGAFTSQVTVGWLADRMHSFDGAISLMVGTVFLAAILAYLTPAFREGGS